MRIIFFGTPEFSARTLDFLIESGVSIAAVISKPDKPKGRSREPVPTPVKELLLSKYPHIPLYQPEKVSDLAFKPIIEAEKGDLFVVVAYGEIIKDHLLQMPSRGCINLHTSLLPKFRGAAPLQRAIMQGEKESGVTIMHMVKKMDAGDMITQSKVTIGENMTFGELEEALYQQGSRDLLKVIKAIEAGSVSATPQNHDDMTLAPKVELEECEINWSQSAQSIHNLIRGVNPEPGAWCWITHKGEKKRLKIFKTLLSSVDVPQGSLVSSPQSKWVVGCSEGSLELVEVQLEGKKRMLVDQLKLGLDISTLNLCL